jgi:GNAT superfamily N-acetyltransferase
MDKILNDLSKPNLIAAIENNLFEIVHCFRQWPKAEVHEDVAIKWSITDIPFPLFNSVVRANLLPEKIVPTIQFLIEQAKSSNVPLLWWTGPQTFPADLGRHLEEHDFVKEEDMPGMAVELAKLKENQTMPIGFHVERVNDDETLKLWCQVTGKGFNMPDFVVEAFYDFINHVGREQMQVYLGWIDDKPVATSLQFLAAGVAGIYNVSTIPEARHRGIGAVMTTYPLLEAHSIGYQVGILAASQMGVNVYRSLGFQELCTIGQYVWASGGPEL